MNKKIGFVGCGKMAQAMIGGILNANAVPANQIIASARTNETLESVKSKFNIKVTSSNQKVAEEADLLFLAVEPKLYGTIIAEIKQSMKLDVIIITIAAGISLQSLAQSFGRQVKAVRTMPNTPSLVSEGMSAICANSSVSHAELLEVMEIFSSFGKVEVIEEGLMDAIPAISGSSPAYVYMFIEALADGGVRDGLPRKQAYRLAAQAVLGAAKMVLETGQHPGELKDQVCTPGGSTIEAVAELEKSHFRAAILSAMESCTSKTKGISED